MERVGKERFWGAKNVNDILQRDKNALSALLLMAEKKGGGVWLQKGPMGLLSSSISHFDSVIGSLLPRQSYRIGTISILPCYSNIFDSLDIISQVLYFGHQFISQNPQHECVCICVCVGGRVRVRTLVHVITSSQCHPLMSLISFPNLLWKWTA